MHSTPCTATCSRTQRRDQRRAAQGGGAEAHPLGLAQRGAHSPRQLRGALRRAQLQQSLEGGQMAGGTVEHKRGHCPPLRWLQVAPLRGDPLHHTNAVGAEVQRRAAAGHHAVGRAGAQLFSGAFHAQAAQQAAGQRGCRVDAESSGRQARRVCGKFLVARAPELQLRQAAHPGRCSSAVRQRARRTGERCL